MSHIHKNHYKDIDQLIAYINGFLWPLEILNDETNRGQTYYVEEILKLETYEASIKKHLNDLSYGITLTEIIDWELELKKTSTTFFESILSKIELSANVSENSIKYGKTKREALNFSLINEMYISLIKELLTDDTKFYEVMVDWSKGSFYECYYKDYLVDTGKGLFFMHFGEAD